MEASSRLDRESLTFGDASEGDKLNLIVGHDSTWNELINLFAGKRSHTSKQTNEHERSKIKQCKKLKEIAK